MSNIIDSIQVSGTVYQIQGSGGGNNVIELTQAQYDALVDKDPTVFYIITDAEAVDLANYYTKSETSGATQISTALNAKADTATTYTKTEVDTALASKQTTLVSGTNIKTINNESILGSGNITIEGGGGKAIEAGRGISVTTGATADTVSFNLPIWAGTGQNSILVGYENFGTTWEPKATGKYSIVNGPKCLASKDVSLVIGYMSSGTSNYTFAQGYGVKAAANNSHAQGQDTVANGVNSHAEGYGAKTNNEAEHASGKYNVSSSGSSTFGDSGNTLFSVGNGTADNARHNAFEIRQNGDIYCSDGTNDVKLQDTITATAANTTALGGLKLVKLTQAEYDALTTKDSNTLYIING